MKTLPGATNTMPMPDGSTMVIRHGSGGAVQVSRVLAPSSRVRHGHRPVWAGLSGGAKQLDMIKVLSLVAQCWTRPGFPTPQDMQM